MNITGNFETRAVEVDGQKLDPKPSQTAWNHSPDGFLWGYNGSGPAQLALAILLHAGLDQETAIGLHQAFKREVIAILPQADFEIEIDLKLWLFQHGVQYEQSH